ncbi:MAG: BON domain-containing protein, partial [Alphaproteobacteria bacterium]|nr:BON domain-containing protein [Alphaproteobacteria bacterium]
TVDWDYQRSVAEHHVRKLGGVVAVLNEIGVEARVRPDDVHAKIRGALERNAEIEADQITVRIAAGKVTLSGTVSSWAEREAAERAAWSAPGVTEVEDRIELVRP